MERRGGGGRKWAIDLSETSSSSRDIADPPGFSKASLDAVSVFLTQRENGYAFDD